MERAMGLEPITVCLEGRDSSHWATPARGNWAHALYKKDRCCQKFFRRKFSLANMRETQVVIISKIDLSSRSHDDTSRAPISRSWCLDRPLSIVWSIGLYLESAFTIGEYCIVLMIFGIGVIDTDECPRYISILQDLVHFWSHSTYDNLSRSALWYMRSRL
jgi:hypothetical protein